MRTRSPSFLLRDLFLGLRFGYPPCCIAHYLWDGVRGWPSGMMRWLEIAHQRSTSPVPCGVFHSGGSGLGLGARLRSIARIQVSLLRPLAGREPRREARFGAHNWGSASIQQRDAWSPEANAREYWRGIRLHAHPGFDRPGKWKMT